MAWTIAVVLAVVSLATVLLFLAKTFDKSKHAMKVFLIMLTFASLILISQVMNLIIKDKASSINFANLQTLSVTTLTLSIVVFLFFSMYFFVTYTKGIIVSLRNAKKDKITEQFGEI